MYSQVGEPLGDPTDLQAVDLVTGTGLERSRLADDEGARGHAEGAQVPDKVPARLVPGEQDGDAARERRVALEDGMVERAERLVEAGATPARTSSRRSVWPRPRPAVKVYVSGPTNKRSSNESWVWIEQATDAATETASSKTWLSGRPANVSRTSAWRTKNSPWYSLTTGRPTRATLLQWMRRSGSPGR